MDRRELLKGAAAGGLAGLAGNLLGARVTLAAAGQADSEAAAAMADLQAVLDKLESDFATSPRLRSPQDFAEARRVMLHALLHGLECWLEAEPERPFFRPFIHQHKKLLGDNPDARYFSAAVSSEYRYRIRGNLAGATYTSFSVELAPDPSGPGIGSAINDTQFRADRNGNYEIIASRDRVEGNWLPLPAGAVSVTTRHYYERPVSINNDRLHNIPIDIENLDPPGPRAPLNDAGIAAGIRRVADFVRGNVILVQPENSPSWVSRVPNQFVPPVVDDSNRNVGYAAVDNVYAMAPFLLQPDQALLIRGRFPRCRFSNLVLFNQFMQTLDYETRTISLNRAQTAQDANGRFEIILAHRDPGRPNWLDTEGRAFGMMFWRFQLPEEDIAPLETELITL